MVNVITIDPAKDPRWDQFVSAHSLGWIVHLSGWKQLLESTFPHMKGHCLALTDPATDTIKAALPLYEVRSWLTGNRLVSIPLAQLTDPLVENSADMERLIAAALDLSKSLKTSHVEIRTLDSLSLLKTKHSGVDEVYRHHFLKLDRDLEAIKKSFHYKAVRYEINKAARNKLGLKVADSEADLEDFQELFTQTRKRLGAPYQPYPFLKSIWDTFYPLNMIKLLLARHRGRTIAGLLFFEFNGRFSAEIAGWDRSFSDMSPNHFLYWEGIKLAHQGGNRIFDFGITSTNNETLVNFKSRWGTTMVDQHRYYYSEAEANDFFVNETSPKHRLIEGICKHSPGWFYRMFGNFCFRHMG